MYPRNNVNTRKRGGASNAARANNRSNAITNRRNLRVDPIAAYHKMGRRDLNDSIPPEFDFKTSTQLYKVRQVFDATPANGSSSDAFNAYNFKLSDIAQYTTYTALFDQYRIRAVAVTFRPKVTDNVPTYTSVTVSAAPTPLLYTIIDYDDSNIPASLDELRQYDSVVETRFDRSVTRLVQPHIALAAYSGTFTSYANKKNMWIDVASPSVQHYGIKFGITGTGSQTWYQTWYIEFEYFLEFRCIR